MRLQMETLLRELPPAAAKTGMLFNAGIIRTVAENFARHREIPLVVDPVMIATSGARLLRPDALRALQDRLLPLAALVTPNLDEAAALLGRPLRSVDDLRWAARGMHGRWGVPVLVKGGHLRDVPQATDILWDGQEERVLRAPFVSGVSTHGTGCTYSAAIVAFLALDQSRWSTESCDSQYARSWASLANVGMGLVALFINCSLLSVHVPGGNHANQLTRPSQGQRDVQ